jgi:hypothetical protein
MRKTEWNAEQKCNENVLQEILKAIFDFQQRFLNGSKPDDDVMLVVIKIAGNILIRAMPILSNRND